MLSYTNNDGVKPYTTIRLSALQLAALKKIDRAPLNDHHWKKLHSNLRQALVRKELVERDPVMNWIRLSEKGRKALHGE